MLQIAKWQPYCIFQVTAWRDVTSSERIEAKCEQASLARKHSHAAAAPPPRRDEAAARKHRAQVEVVLNDENTVFAEVRASTAPSPTPGGGWTRAGT